MRTPRPTHAPVPRLALRPAEVAAALGIGIRLVWRLLATGHLPVCRAAGRGVVLVPVAAVEELLSVVEWGARSQGRTQWTAGQCRPGDVATRWGLSPAAPTATPTLPPHPDDTSS